MNPERILDTLLIFGRFVLLLVLIFAIFAILV